MYRAKAREQVNHREASPRPASMFSNTAWDTTLPNFIRRTTSEKDGLAPSAVARCRGRDAQDSLVAQRVRPVSSGCYEHGSATAASNASTTTARTRVENRHVRTSSRTPRAPSKRDPQGGLVNASHFGLVARRCCAHSQHPHPPPRASVVAKHVVVDTDCSRLNAQETTKLFLFVVSSRVETSLAHTDVSRKGD